MIGHEKKTKQSQNKTTSILSHSARYCWVSEHARPAGAARVFIVTQIANSPYKVLKNVKYQTYMSQ